MSTWRLQQKNLTPCNLLSSICSHKRMFAIITNNNHMLQKNCKSEFIIKDKKNQMTMINKITITIITIIINNSLVQRTLNKLVINIFTIQINYAQNDACT